MAPPRNLKARAKIVASRLAEAYPGTAVELCALRHDGPFQLLVATILSAQTTDARVNMVTPALFAEFPDAQAMAGADPARVEEMVRQTGFFRSKTKSLLGMARGLVERFDGQVPVAIEDLVTLPGVGRKTANVVRSVAFDAPGLPVDTHVGRLARRLGLTAETDPVAVERDLDALLPPGTWGAFSLRLILHGRAICIARAPRCGTCFLADVCPSARVDGGADTGRRARRAGDAAVAAATVVTGDRTTPKRGAAASRAASAATSARATRMSETAWNRP